MAAKIRSIVYDPEFDKELAAISHDFQRADEFIFGVDWILARQPEVGQQLRPDSPVWQISAADFPHTPAVVIFYAFDDDRVYVLAIKMISRNGDC